MSLIRATILYFSLIAMLSATALAVDRATVRWLNNHPYISEIKFVDADQLHFDPGTIKGRMYSSEAGWWSKTITKPRNIRVQKETLARDTLAIRAFYLANGFLNVGIEQKFEVAGEDSTARIVVKINEGTQYFYGPKDIAGNAQYDFRFNAGKMARRLEDGKPINRFEVQQTAIEMRSYMANNGYPYADVNVDIDTTAGDPKSTPITFTLRADTIVHYGEIMIRGTSVYPEYVARRELTIEQGDVFSRKEIFESQRRLFESGYFNTANLRRADTAGNRLYPDYMLTVRERDPYYVSFRTGAAQSEVRDLIWSVNPGGGIRKLFGSRRLDLDLEYAFSLGSDTRLVEHRYRLRFTEPWFLGIRMPMRLTFEWEPTLRDPVQDFKRRSVTIGVSTYKRFSPILEATIGTEVEFVKFSGIPEDQIDELRSQTDNRARRNIFVDIRRDTRNDPFIATRGSLTELRAQYYGGFLGGDENFYNIEASFSRYLRVWPGWILASRVRGTYSQPFAESEFIPLDEANYLGGANTVRSFKENDLGRFFLQPDSVPVAPEYTIVYNLEFRWKTIQIFSWVPGLGSLPLYQTLFFDVGNGFRPESHFNFALDNLAYAYGSGVQFITPAGPIRIDYARRLKTERFDVADRWHFTILYAF